MKHIVHLSSVHPDNDIRIFKKQCVSLSHAGFKVSYLVINGKSRFEEGVEIIGIPYKIKGRLDRALNATKLLFQKALELNADVFQIHDPEMMRIAIKLRHTTKARIIADVHEYTAGQIMQKHYIPTWAQGMLSKSFAYYENRLLKQFDGVIKAVDFEGTYLAKANRNQITIHNYPILNEFQKASTHPYGRLIYVGGISPDRGLERMLKILQRHPDWYLELAGPFFSESYSLLPEKYGVTKQVNYHGILNRTEVAKLYSRGGIGLLLFTPKPNLAISLPIKMFEYMASGLTVVGNDFTHWKPILQETGAGVCLNPDDEKALDQTLQNLFDNPKLMHSMGQRAYETALSKFSWNAEAEKLTQFYNQLLGIS